MTFTYTWTIGSSSSCDVVIDVKTVSTKHCRVTRIGNEYTIEDLQSTNGTYVNGVRIDQPTNVTSRDRICMGQNVGLSWPRLNRLTNRKVITIGRATDNHVVLDLPNVSAHHARIVIEPNGLLIEDLNSTNGTAVNSVDNKITRESISPDSVVYFGTTPVPVMRLTFGTDLRTSHSPGETSVSDICRGRLWGWTAGLLLVGVLMMAFILWGLDDRSDGNANVEQPLVSQGEELISHDLSVGGPVTRSESDGRAAEVESAVSGSEETRPDDALFWVIVKDSADKQAYRLGTAWAVAPRLVVTTANVVYAARTLMKDEFPVNRIYSPTTRQEIAITKTTVHADFQAAATAAEAARQEYDELLRTLETEASSDEELAATKASLLDLREQWFMASEKQVYFDVAVLEIEESVSATLPLVEELAAAPRPKMRVEVQGLAFDREDPFLELGAKPQELEVASRVRQVVGYDEEGHTYQRLCVECDSSQLEYDLTGSPVTNAQGRVLGMYSRPSPNADPTQPPPGDTFDAVLADTIRSLVPAGK